MASSRDPWSGCPRRLSYFTLETVADDASRYLSIPSGEYPDRLDDPGAMEDRRLQVLYLRHWDRIASHFISVHGVAVREAYGSQPIPLFDGASRVDVLRFSDEFSGDRSSEGYSLFM